MKSNGIRSIFSSVVLATIFSLLVTGCGPSREELAAIDACIEPLRKIAAATKSGISLQDLGKMYVEAQAAFDTRKQKIQNPQFLAAIQKALEAYEDSLRGSKATQKQSLRGIFREYRGSNNSLSVGDDVFLLVDKYRMKWGEFDNKSDSFISYDQFISNMWAIAETQTNAAAAAVSQ